MELTMAESTIGFLRDNPFIKNDAAHRRITNFRLPPSASFPTSASPSFANVSLKSAGLSPSTTTPLFSCSKMATPAPIVQQKEPKILQKEDKTYVVSIGSDVEYGPGIVERLRAKFNKLSGLAIKGARLSPHATCKRCPSMDDILSSHENSPPESERGYETLDRHWGGGANGGGLQRQHSRSVSDVAEQKRKFVVHRQVNLDDQDDDDSLLPDISSLRKKFETNASRMNWENKRNDQIVVSSPSPYRDPSPERPAVLSPLPQRPSPQTQNTILRPTPASFVKPTPVLNLHIYETVAKDAPAAQRRPQSMDLSTNEIPHFEKDAPPPKSLKLSEPQHNRLRVLEVLNRTEPVGEKEPEFVRIGRRLRRSSTSEDVPSETVLSPSFEESIPSAHNLPFVRRSTRPTPVIPSLSSSARVVYHPTTLPISTYSPLTSPINNNERMVEQRTVNRSIESTVHHHSVATFAKDSLDRRETSRTPYTPNLIDTFTSPPDPDSARTERPAEFSPRVVPQIPPPVEGSPPPEEPKPPKVTPMNDSPDSLIFTKNERTVVTNALPSYVMPKILPANNDDSGKNEMQRLLDRFNQTRDKKLFVEENNEVPKIQRLAQPPTSAFVSTVTGVRVSDGRTVLSVTSPSKSPPKQQPTAPSNVVSITSITIRDEQKRVNKDGEHLERLPTEPTTISRPSEVVPKRPAPPPPIDVTVDTTTVPSTSSALSIPSIETQSTSTSLMHDYIPSAPSDSTQRKSLSSQFLEQQAKLNKEQRNGKPYGDDITEIKTVVDELPSVVLDSEEESKDEVMSVSSDVDIQHEQGESVCSEELHREKDNESSDSHNRLLDSMEERCPSADVISYDMDSLEGDTADIIDSDSEVINEAAIQEHLRSTILQDSEGNESEEDETAGIIFHSNLMNFGPSLMAGDGNPVRNSLISLVMEEDIPALMEAMHETYRFEFVDVNENAQPSTSSIIHPPEKRKQRKETRKIGRISFVDIQPEVYTYLDERSAEREKDWIDGSHVTYEMYQTICDAEQAEYRRNVEELERWKASIVQQTVNRVEITPADSDCSLGVTNKFQYQTITENSTISV